MAGLDDGADEPRDSDTVAAHVRRYRCAVGAGHLEAHRGRIFLAEVEDVPDLDPAAGAARAFRQLFPAARIVGFVGRGVG